MRHEYTAGNGFVVAPWEGGVDVKDETGATVVELDPDTVDALAGYFREAWLYARPGEFWLLEHDGQEIAYQAFPGAFQMVAAPSLRFAPSRFTWGRRIWEHRDY